MRRFCKFFREAFAGPDGKWDASEATAGLCWLQVASIPFLFFNWTEKTIDPSVVGYVMALLGYLTGNKIVQIKK